jgi:Protein of unknown function (DUF3089)
MSKPAAGNFCTFFFIILISQLIYSCAPKITPYTGEQLIQSTTGIPDYTRLEFWAAHPDKWDPSDSVPSPLRKSTVDKMADVFFLHPTTFTDEKYVNQGNAAIDDPYLNKKTDYGSILYQASVFNESCNVYAPRYRQAHLQMYYTTDTAKALAAFELAYQDIKSAFNVFLSKRNPDIPFIIASHSQGTTHAKRLLKEFVDGSTLQKKLVAAYILGIAVEKTLYTNLPLCIDSSSTGCFISWRTYREGYEGRYVSRTDTSIAVINPLLWSNDPIKAERELQKGAVLYKFNKLYPHTQSSRIVGNALWISKPHFPGGVFFVTKNYHAGDFNLFYLDIREDVARRIKYFKIKQK